ncbi:MAG: sensor histidine kinase [Fimbriimonadaceae bacterium]|nr:sensor histidine kinase [Chitinophagales bacterium]
MKNITPAQVVLRVSLLVSVFILILELLIYYFEPLQTVWVRFIAIPFIAGILAYISFYIALEKFIYRKIKLIYKNIHDLKSTKEITDQKVNMRSDVIDDMRDEVLEWAKDRSMEIDQLKKSEMYRKEFLGNVSHELKTPITSIQGYLETLLDGGMDDPEINLAYLQKAMRNVERMVTVVDDLESIANLETRELPLQYENFDVTELTKDVFDDLEIVAKNHKIKMRIKEGCDKSFYVSADKKLVREVLVNLVSNAIKYGKDNGIVSAGIYNMGENILIEISDDGIGIAKEHLQRVFERFYRIEKSRSRDFGGSGLGLSIVKHVVEAHGQTISIRSTPGEGSTLGFTLKKAK